MNTLKKIYNVTAFVVGHVIMAASILAAVFCAYIAVSDRITRAKYDDDVDYDFGDYEPDCCSDCNGCDDTTEEDSSASEEE